MSALDHLSDIEFALCDGDMPKGWKKDTIRTLSAALTSVIDMHPHRVALNGVEWCDKCHDGDWPCAEIRAITTALEDEDD